MSVNVASYLRVSSARQGRSGLGLDAQRAAVRRFAEDECLTISAEYIEIETGKGARLSMLLANFSLPGCVDSSTPGWPKRRATPRVQAQRDP